MTPFLVIFFAIYTSLYDVRIMSFKLTIILSYSNFESNNFTRVIT